MPANGIEGSTILSRRDWLGCLFPIVGGAAFIAGAPVLDPTINTVRKNLAKSIGLYELDASLPARTENHVTIINEGIVVTPPDHPVQYRVSVNTASVLATAGRIAQILDVTTEFNKALPKQPLVLSLGESVGAKILSPVATYLDEFITKLPRVCIPPEFLESTISRLYYNSENVDKRIPDLILVNELTHVVCDMVGMKFPVTNFNEAVCDFLSGLIASNALLTRRKFLPLILALPYVFTRLASDSQNSGEQVAIDTANKFSEKPEQKLLVNSIFNFQLVG